MRVREFSYCGSAMASGCNALDKGHNRSNEHTLESGAYQKSLNYNLKIKNYILSEFTFLIFIEMLQNVLVVQNTYIHICT